MSTNKDYTSKTDTITILKGLKSGKLKFQDLDEKIKDDKRYALYAINLNPKNALYIKDHMFIKWKAINSNKRLFNKVVTKDILKDKEKFRGLFRFLPTIMKYASNKLRKDKNFLLEMIKVNPSGIQFADINTIRDYDFLEKAMKIDKHMFRHLYGICLTEETHPEFFIEYENVKEYYSSIYYNDFLDLAFTK